jgi:hypothetical protein
VDGVPHGLSQRPGACWLFVRREPPLTLVSFVQALLWDKQKLNLWQQTRLLASFQKRIAD